FPPADGLPGDPLAGANPFTIKSYLVHASALLRTLLVGLRTRRDVPGAAIGDGAPVSDADAQAQMPPAAEVESFVSQVAAWMRFGALTAAAGLIEAAALVEVVVRALPRYPQTLALQWLNAIAGIVRTQLEGMLCADEDTRCKWEIIDLVLAILVGAVRHRLLLDPRGLDAVNAYECRDWLRMNGASERSLNSAFVRSLYDLALAYEAGDARRPGLAAGQALRGSLRMFFTYRGAMFWKMRAGMGDCVFAPFYEVLKRRGVRFEFFHRLENVRLAAADTLAPDERPYVQALEFDVQARTLGGAEYRPLVDVKGLPCWPATPDHAQLVDGARLQQEGWQFESHGERRRADTTTLQVGRDFDFVVLGVSIGAIPRVAREILARDERWRAMVANVKTVATQAFQVWLREDMRELGWNAPAITLSGFVKPFDTWSDMTHLIAAEDWGANPPKAVAYFCGVLPDPAEAPPDGDPAYEAARREEVFGNAAHFLDHHLAGLWPGAVGPDGFRWSLLVDANPPADGAASPDDARALRSQYWAANVNPSDRYVLALPGSLQYRISPLDNSYDNLTIAGDWTDCGFNEGCVEAAVMSGRLAAHALAHWPPLADIIGYDHP
ncbi:MAG TPA: FAD-dependent oxidoreductase, partial [Variovorax sp.]